MTRPQILVIDDVFGRSVEGHHPDRELLCAHFLWRDVSPDAPRVARQTILQPTADVTFCRGQRPARAHVGDFVVNDESVALEAMRKGPPSGRVWAMILLDLSYDTGVVTPASNAAAAGMPEVTHDDQAPGAYFGLKILDTLRAEAPQLPILILSSKPRSDVALEFNQKGALGFIERGHPDAAKELERALYHHGLLPDWTGKIIGDSLPLLLTLRAARQASKSGKDILVRGDRGTGKQLLVEYIHNAAGADRPLITMNSATFTPELFTSELFGIEPNTATGVAGRPGLIDLAAGGDLFFDELGDMPPEVQAALLSFLESRMIRRVGANHEHRVNLRVLAATEIAVEEMSVGFRKSLQDRFGSETDWIRLPSLRDRPEDIPLLVEYFLRRAESANNEPRRREVTPESLQQLQAHDCPGNIRELRGAIEGAVNRHPGVEYLVPNHLRLSTKTRFVEQDLRDSTDAAPTTPLTLNDVANAIKRAEFSGDFKSWMGKLPELETAVQHMMVQIIHAAIQVVKNTSTSSPGGSDVRYHRVYRLLVGETNARGKKISASQAADAFKRLLKPIPKELLTSDVSELLQRCIESRKTNADT